MTIKQVINIHNFIVLQQNHWSFYIVGYFLLCITQQSYTIPGMDLLIWLMLGMLPFLFYLIREKVKFKIFHWLIYLLVLAGVFFLPVPHVAYTYIYIGCAAYYCISSGVWDVFSESDDEYKPISVLIVFGVALLEIFILQYIKLYEYQRSLVHLVIWNVLLYCMSVYVNNYVKYLIVNRHSIGYMPVKSILHFGIHTMLAFSGVLAVLMLIVANVGQMGDVLHYILSWFEVFREKVREFMKEFRDGKHAERDFNIIEPEGEWNGGLLPSEEVAEGFGVWDIIMIVIVCVILLLIAFKIMRYVLEVLKRLMTYIPKATEDGLEIQESCDVVERIEKKKRENILETLTPQMRIRKRYRKKMWKEQDFITERDKRSRMELYTARECSDILVSPEIADIYEKARYSPYECTAEDVKRIRNACKN